MVIFFIARHFIFNRCIDNFYIFVIINYNKINDT